MKKKVTNEVINLYKSMDTKCPTLAKTGRNLSYLAASGQLDPVYGRENFVKQIGQAMLRHSKPNVLLVGQPGCGKTAIAEAFAMWLADRRIERGIKCRTMEAQYNEDMETYRELSEKNPDIPAPAKPKFPEMERYTEWVVYDLPLNSLVSGTKYRGDFEEKVEAIIQETAKNPNVIVFIDEMHMMAGLGKAEGSMSADQALKPALARGQIRVIGATTCKELDLLKGDGALMRRFSLLDIPVLSGEVAAEVATNILADYCKIHKVKTKVDAKELLAKCDYFIENGVFPNHFIDVVDTTLASAVFDGKKSVEMSNFNETLSAMTGLIIL